MTKITQRGNSYQCQHADKTGRVRRSFPTEAVANEFRKILLGWRDQGLPLKEAERNALSDLEASQRVAERDTLADPKNLGELFQVVKMRHWSGHKTAPQLIRQAEIVLTVLGHTTPLRSINHTHPQRLIDYFKDKGAANGTINRKTAALSKMLRYAYERGWIAAVPVIPRLRESEGRTLWLRPGEEEPIIRWFTHRGMHREANLVTVLIDTGARLSEALGYRWRDDTPDLFVITADRNKSSIHRAIPKTQRVREILEGLRKGEARDGPFEGITPNQFHHRWDRMRGELGHANDPEFVPHMLRHSYASRLASAGVPLQGIQQLMGHKTITMTMRYSHLCPTALVGHVDTLESYLKTIGDK